MPNICAVQIESNNTDPKNNPIKPFAIGPVKNSPSDPEFLNSGSEGRG
jgi:hypothetical protein